MFCFIKNQQLFKIKRLLGSRESSTKTHIQNVCIYNRYLYIEHIMRVLDKNQAYHARLKTIEARGLLSATIVRDEHDKLDSIYPIIFSLFTLIIIKYRNFVRF